MIRLLALLLLCPALAFGTGLHRSPVVKPPVVPPNPVAPAQPASQPASSSHTTFPSWLVFVGVAVYFGAVIYTHAKCVEEKRGCYRHVAE